MENDTERLLDELSEKFAKTVLPVTVIVGIETVLGFFGNVLVIYVFLRHYRVCTFKYFALCLAFIDVTCCITTMSGEMVTQLYWYKYPERVVCKIKSFFNVFTVIAEALCLLTIALDRYRKVCRPFSWQIKPRVAKYLCGIHFIVAFILALPVAFLWGVRSATHVYKNVTLTVTLCEKDAEFETTEYPIGYISTVCGIVHILLIIIFVQYVFVARKLFKSRHHRIGSNLPMVSNCSNVLQSQHDVTGSREEYSDNNRDSVNEHPVEISNSTCMDSKTPNDKPMETNQESNDRSITQEKLSFERQIPLRVKRKTLIMFILTLTFIITICLYFVLLILIASPADIIQYLNDGGKVAYFFCLRLYFINHVINPFVFGLLDPQFKIILKTLARSLMSKNVYSQ